MPVTDACTSNGADSTNARSRSSLPTLRSPASWPAGAGRWLTRQNPPSCFVIRHGKENLNLHQLCRFHFHMAVAITASSAFPKFQSRWRTPGSIFDGGSYNRTVVQIWKVSATDQVQTLSRCLAHRTDTVFPGSPYVGPRSSSPLSTSPAAQCSAGSVRFSPRRGHLRPASPVERVTFQLTAGRNPPSRIASSTARSSSDIPPHVP